MATIKNYQVLKIVQEMRKKGIIADKSMQRTILSLVSQTGNIVAMENLYQEFINSHNMVGQYIGFKVTKFFIW